MTFIKAIKAIFTPENQIIRHLIKAQVMARNTGYTILPGVLQEVISAFEKGYEQDEDFPDWCGIPANDNDIQGIFEILVWHAKKSGWSPDKLHYFDILYAKAKEQVELHGMIKG